MLVGFLKLVFIICTVVVILLSIVTTQYFMNMPETHKFKSYLACDVIVLWVVALVLILKIVTI